MEDAICASCAVGSFASSPIQRLARLLSEPDEAEFGRLLREESGVEDESFAACLRKSCGVCSRGAKLYPSARELVISFNGGKDACVVLFLWLAAVLATASNGLEPEQQTVVFFDSADEFREIQAFVAWIVSSLGLHMVKIEKKSFRLGMQDVVSQGVRAIVMGQRFGDPFTPTSAFSPSTEGWPAFMRINPILEWSYAHVWTFLRCFGLPYCNLYDDGYTSLGSSGDTIRNPCLRRPDGSYAPAYELQDACEERKGRGVKANGTTGSNGKVDARKEAGEASPKPQGTIARCPSRGPAPRTAGVILIGDELLSDKAHNANSSLLCEHLRSRGIAVRLVEVVQGRQEAISAAVRRASEAYDLVFASGGIGPPHDDERTLKDVAKAFERDLAEKALVEHASLPSEGPKAFNIDNVHVLPGAPDAFRRALERAIDGGLLGLARPWALGSLELDLEEAAFSEALRCTAAEFPDVMLGAYAGRARQNGSQASASVTVVDFASLDEERLAAARKQLLQAVPAQALRHN